MFRVDVQVVKGRAKPYEVLGPKPSNRQREALNPEHPRTLNLYRILKSHSKSVGGFRGLGVWGVYGFRSFRSS